jgi:hypothetical protein
MLLTCECALSYHSFSEDRIFNLSQLLCNRFRLQAHVLAELFNSNNLVLLLLKMVLDLLNKISAIPVASACDYLNVFRINTQSIHSSIYNLILYPYFIYAFELDELLQI